MKRDESLSKVMQINFYLNEVGTTDVNIQIKKQFLDAIFDESFLSSKNFRLDILNTITAAAGEVFEISREELNSRFEKTKSDMEGELSAEWIKIKGDWN